jgi:hypothetical protein
MPSARGPVNAPVRLKAYHHGRVRKTVRRTVRKTSQVDRREDNKIETKETITEGLLLLGWNQGADGQSLI